MLPDKIAFVDLETTGARPAYDRIIELGILRVENNEIVDTYSSLFNPYTYISPFIENLTGITVKDVENAPTFNEEAHKIRAMLDGCVFVAHNVRFDYGFLRNEFRRIEESFTAKHFCTVKLSRALYPQFRKHDLDSLIGRFNISCSNRHRAFDDAMVLFEFFRLIQNEFPNEKVVHAVSQALKRPSRPIQISEKSLDNLPDSPGVYLFYSDETTPLYIGKSINIRERVLSHFASDALSGIDMVLSREVKRIEYIETGGELSALLKESALIKQMQPLYNRKLRQSRKLTVLIKSTTTDGYETVSIETFNQSDITTENYRNILGITRSKKKAKDLLLHIAKEYHLCHKLLNLEKTKTGCFANKLGWCKGACKGKEIPAAYNIRVLQAFTKHRLKPWPFDNAVIIEENHSDSRKKEIFIVDKWCVLESYTGTDTEIQSSENEYIFDVDTYKILVSFLRSPRNLLKVKQIESIKGEYLQKLSRKYTTTKILS